MTNHLKVGENGKDPLTNNPMSHQELFKQFSALASDFPLEAVEDAAANILLNVLRQKNASWRMAEANFDELFGRLKSIFSQHYDTTADRRRSVFPFHQVIEPEFFTSKKH